VLLSDLRCKILVIMQKVGVDKFLEQVSVSGFCNDMPSIHLILTEYYIIVLAVLPALSRRLATSRCDAGVYSTNERQRAKSRTWIRKANKSLSTLSSTTFVINFRVVILEVEKFVQ